MKIKIEDLHVKVNGVYFYSINETLLKKQRVEKNLKAIVKQHEIKLNIFFDIAAEEDEEILKVFASWITDIEFTLQELWHFPKDIKYHKFWKTPKCSCPKMDNDDAYPIGYYINSVNCKLHGSGNEKERCYFGHK